MSVTPGRKRMSGFADSISLEEAISRMASIDWKRPGHTLRKSADCFGLIANEKVLAAIDVPEQSVSAVDGYAIRARDTYDILDGEGREFPVAGISEAGKGFTGTVPSGTCCEIYTGAPIPDECDSVIMAEDVNRHGDIIRINRKTDIGKNVRSKGEDIKAGLQIAIPGDLLNSFRIGACISSGVSEIDVLDPLNVSVISTGDELIEGSERHIANSSQRLIVDYFSRRWLNFKAAGVCPDDPECIRSKIEKEISVSDIVVVTGGTSLGMKDLVPEAMMEFGKTIFSGINMRPGRTITLYESGRKPVFSISGLPGPGLTSFETLFEVYVQKCLGIHAVRKTVYAKASRNIELKKDSTTLRRVKILSGKDGACFEAVKSSGIFSLLESDGVIQFEPEINSVKEGEIFPVKLNGWEI